MVLVTAGSVKRAQMAAAREAYAAKGEAVDEAAVADGINEQMALIQSVADTCIPKLVSDDIPLLESLMADVFLGVKYQASPDERLREIIVEVCEERHLRPTDNFVGKVPQLYGVVNLTHGLVLLPHQHSQHILIAAILPRVQHRQVLGRVAGQVLRAGGIAALRPLQRTAATLGDGRAAARCSTVRLHASATHESAASLGSA